MKLALKIKVKGRVQGVGYRWFCTQKAADLNIKGYVKNLPDGSVEVLAQGESTTVYEFLDFLREGPSFAQVTETRVLETDFNENIYNFKVIY